MLHIILSYCNVAGLILNFTGGIIVFIFGLPPIGLINESMYVGMEITKKMRNYILISRFGFSLIIIGFFLQLVSSIIMMQ